MQDDFQRLQAEITEHLEQIERSKTSVEHGQPLVALSATTLDKLALLNEQLGRACRQMIAADDLVKAIPKLPEHSERRRTSKRS